MGNDRYRGKWCARKTVYWLQRTPRTSFDELKKKVPNFFPGSAVNLCKKFERRGKKKIITQGIFYISPLLLEPKKKTIHVSNFSTSPPPTLDTVYKHRHLASRACSQTFVSQPASASTLFARQAANQSSLASSAHTCHHTPGRRRRQSISLPPDDSPLIGPCLFGSARQIR